MSKRERFIWVCLNISADKYCGIKKRGISYMKSQSYQYSVHNTRKVYKKL